MKEKKTVGFDILDNAGLNEIDKIGTDIDMLDEKTKKRILEMTRKRYNDAIKGENTGIYNTDINKSEEVVENVEVYNRSKIRRIMTGVVNTAAVVGLAAGSVFLIKNLGRGDIDKPVEPDLPAVSTTEPANQTQEEKARNQRIEEYIQELYNQYVRPDEEQFYNSLEIKYAYLDINNDSVSELLISYDFIEAAADAKGIGLNYFDGSEYIPMETMANANDMKFDLQNRRLYDLVEGHENGYSLFIKTWENNEISHESDFFTLQDFYYSGIDPFIDGTGEHVYLRNSEPCTKEEYESAWAEYENCDSAMLNFFPYNVKKPVGNAVQTKTTAANTNNEETLQTTIATTNKPTQETLDKARDAVLKSRFDKHNKNNYVSMYYAYYDINDDSVPELIIDNEFNLHWEMEIYKFNSTDFEFKTSVEHTQGVILCKSEKSIEGHAKTPSMVTNICYYNDELEFGLVDKWILGYNYDENGNMYDEYKHNDTVITEEEYRAHVHECDNCVFFNDVEFLLYQTNNPQGNEEIARERLFTNKYSPRDYPTTYYAHTDLNSDGKSELVVLCRDENNIETVEMYSFNGDEYVFLIRTTGIFKLDLANNRLFSGFADGDDIKYIVVKTWDSECNLTTLKSISQTDEGFKETVAEYEACEDIYLEYIQCW